MSRNKQRNKELSLTMVKGRLSLFLDSRISKELLKEIIALGIEPVLLPPYKRLPEAVSCHPDMLLFDLGDALLVYRDYYETNKALFDGVSVVLTEHAAGNMYPYDVGMDALSLEEFLYCLPQATCPEILLERVISPVKQGYAACSALKVIENAIVTADTSIAKAAEKNGVSVLKITPGHIELPGYEYGFIGGTAFKWDNTLYFAGDLSTHPDGSAIAEFCAFHGVKVHSLAKGTKLRDLGFLKSNTTNG